MPQTLDQALAHAKLPETTVTVCLDHAAELQLADLEQADPKPTAAAVRTLRKQVDDASVEVRLRAVPWETYGRLLGTWAPRPDYPSDAMFGVNTLRFFPALVRASIVEPVLDDAAWAQLEEIVTDAQFNTLADAAFRLART